MEGLSEYFIFRRDSGESAGIGAWVSPLVQERINAIWEENVGPGLLTMRPEEVRQEMRKYLARGVDFVKVAVSAHGVVGQPLMFTPEVLKVSPRRCTRPERSTRPTPLPPRASG